GRGGLRSGRGEMTADPIVCPADETVLAAVEIPVQVEVVDGRVGPACRNERVEIPALEKEVRAGAGLVAVVLANDAFLRYRIVRLAYARQEHQVNVIDGISAQ